MSRLFKIIAVFIITSIARLYTRVGILSACGNHLHDRIIAIRRQGWVDESTLAHHLFFYIKVPEPS